jgi:hypothetical protein
MHVQDGTGFTVDVLERGSVAWGSAAGQGSLERKSAMKYLAVLALLFVAVGTISPQPPSARANAATPRAEPVSTQPHRVSSPVEMTAWDALRQGIQDGDPKHRQTAIAAIGTIGPEHDAVELAERGLKDKNSDVRMTAAETLGEMGSPEAIPALQTALDDSNPQVSFTAAKALWVLGNREGEEIFEEVLEGERKDAPSKIHEAIKKKLKPSQLALMGAESATGAMFGPASIAITAIKEASTDLKGDAGAPGRAEAAAELGKDQDPYALTLLEWALNDPNWAVRVAVAKALGDRGNQATIDKLTPLLDDKHHAVRYMAAASMVKISYKAPGPAETTAGVAQ